MVDQSQPACFARRHLTPSQYMVYDAMFRMAPPPNRLCFGTILTIANNTSLGRDTVIKAIRNMVSLGWLVPDEPIVRWSNTGRWANHRYTVVTHDAYKGGTCPPLKYDPETGENVNPDLRRCAVTGSEVSTRTVSKVSTRTGSEVSE
jgi:hypothetical protein